MGWKYNAPCFVGKGDADGVIEREVCETSLADAIPINHPATMITLGSSFKPPGDLFPMIFEFLGQFTRNLNQLSAQLDKAVAYADHKKFDVKILLQARLAPDQFDFTRQVQMTCDTAKAFASKLTGKEVPKHEDNETSVAELQSRIAKTIQFLGTFQREDFKGWESVKVTNPRREGKYLPANEWVMQQAIPNFFFHATTAYAILRHNGVDVGKKDFLGELNHRAL